MKTYRKPDGKHMDTAVKEMIKGEPLFMFEVTPLDYNIIDLQSPKLWLTKTHLLFTYDEVVEVYDLKELEIDKSTGIPKFTLWQQILEGNYTNTPVSITDIRQSEDIFKVSIKDKDGTPKYFLLRNKLEIQKNYKQWALMQILLNTKNGVAIQPQLKEMLDGHFASFNTKTILIFIVVFVTYLVLRMLLSGLADVVGTVMDWAFGGALLFMLYWVYTSIEKNLKRFSELHRTYSHR